MLSIVLIRISLACLARASTCALRLLLAGVIVGLVGCATTGEGAEEALKRGDFVAVDKIIASADGRHFDNNWAVSRAIAIKSPSAVKYYLAKVRGGASHRFSDRNRTLLMFAATIPNNFDVIRLLVANGASVHDVDSRGMNALDWAKYSGLSGTAELLSSLGGNANVSPSRLAEMKAKDSREEEVEDAKIDAEINARRASQSQTTPAQTGPLVASPVTVVNTGKSLCPARTTFVGFCRDICKSGGKVADYPNYPICRPSEVVCTCR